MADFARLMQQAWAQIESLEIPTIAAINGAATGGGFELALACDVRIAARSARVGLPEVRLGVLPGAGGTQRLTRLAGTGVASLLILSGELVDAERALRLGIVEHVVPDRAFGIESRRVATIIANHSPHATRAIKRCIAKARGDDGYEAEIAASRQLYTTEEARESLRSFALRNQRSR
jgi:enoyl-CoA hydratase